MAEGRIYLSKRSESSSTTLEIYAFDFAGEVKWVKNIITAANFVPLALLVSEDENVILVSGNGSSSVYTLSYDVLYTYSLGGVPEQLFVANNKYYARSYVSYYRADLWESTDGITWNLVAAINYAGGNCVYYNILYSDTYSLYYEQSFISYEGADYYLSSYTAIPFTGGYSFPSPYTLSCVDHLLLDGKIYGANGVDEVTGVYEVAGNSRSLLSLSESMSCYWNTCVYRNTSGDLSVIGTDIATGYRYEWVLVEGVLTKRGFVEDANLYGGQLEYKGIRRHFGIPTSNGYAYVENDASLYTWEVATYYRIVTPYGSAELARPEGSTYYWTAIDYRAGTYPTGEPDFWVERVKCTELYYDYWQRATSTVIDSEGVQLADNITLLVYEAIASDVTTTQTADAINYIGILQIADVVSPQTVTGF